LPLDRPGTDNVWAGINNGANDMKESSSIFITGATGFVGSALIKRLLRENVQITAAVLTGADAGHLSAEARRITVEPLSESSDYTAVLRQVDIVIHLAARVHIMQDTAADPLQEFRKVNTYGTERLAMQAAEAGVKRLVFMSTIGVNGNMSGGKAFSENDDPRPHNAYSLSKLEAEIGLRDISEKTGIEVVIVRAPLIYGPGNPGNFLSLLRIIFKGIPLPLASIVNLKSFLYVGNLTDSLACCACHPKAAGQTFLVSDGKDVSTPELIRRLASALGRPSRLLPFPPVFARFLGKLTGKVAAVDRLIGSLQVDCSKIRRELGWIPPYTMEQGLQKTADWFKDQNAPCKAAKPHKISASS
jgi:nucleoside-diphosphate-sugar epimerase